MGRGESCTDGNVVNRPKLHQRVRITGGPAEGSRGVITRMLRRDAPESWVKLDVRVPAVCAFPADVDEDRAVDDRRDRDALIAWDDMTPEAS